MFVGRQYSNTLLYLLDRYLHLNHTLPKEFQELSFCWLKVASRKLLQVLVLFKH